MAQIEKNYWHFRCYWIPVFISIFLILEPSLSHTIPVNYETQSMIQPSGEYFVNSRTDKTLSRYGVPDDAGYAPGSRRKRYILNGSKWPITNLTYNIEKYPKMLDRAEVDEVIANAFKAWSDVASLNFIRKNSSPVDIAISWESYDHGPDDSKFDGPGGVLAHADYPIGGGDIHFDDSETWTIKSLSGMKSIRNIALHEIGHALGLGHSTSPNSVMYPGATDHIDHLDKDDIQGIQAIYGPRVPTDNSHSKSDTAKPHIGNRVINLKNGITYT